MPVSKKTVAQTDSLASPFESKEPVMVPAPVVEKVVEKIEPEVLTNKPAVEAATKPAENVEVKKAVPAAVVTPTNKVSFVAQSAAPRPFVPQQQPVRPMVQPTPPVQEQLIPITGVIELLQDGSGFVRPKFIQMTGDAYLSSQVIRNMGIRAGDMVTGVMRAKRENEKHPGMVRVDKIEGVEPAMARKRPNFSELTPIYAEKQIKLETTSEAIASRLVDLFAPIGFGQRGMILSPPKAGKTTLLKEIAAGVAINYPEVHLMAVLVGERPEEVTDMQRFIKGEVVASSFDQRPEEQTRAAEIALERAKRLVEMGKDVFIIFDSITRLARAYNLAMPTSGRTLSGGFDPAALYPSKRFFGAARNIEFGGSLTIIGTALVDTGSKMDDLVFEEFKGTGNMEVKLVRELSEKRIFPAIDIYGSGTRRDDLLHDPVTFERMTALRRIFDSLPDKLQPSEMVIEQMRKTKTNADFLAKFGKK